uniref:Solute carrier family 5 member 8 n=1 Tax=Oryzias latipes TaxID=8090 RepID=A0A3P9H469_ORYLA
MSVHQKEANSFGVTDYVVFTLMLGASACIGVYFAWVDRRKKSSGNFLTGGRTLTALPVSMSLTASTMSAIAVLSNPAEVYRFGAIFGLFCVSYFLGAVITSEIFLPVFYRLGFTSTYEVSLVFRMWAIIFVFFINMNLWVGISSTAAVCTFYCTLLGIMLSGFLAVIIKAVIIQGGFSVIFSDAQQGGRLNFWDFDVNPLRRHTFWTFVIGGTSICSAGYGVTPTSVQRYIACRSVTQARLALYINLLGIWACFVCIVFAGLSLYSVYKDCDPWTAGLISSPDQLMPNLVMDILTANPGLPGLFLAAVYSGSLSTVSSLINGLAAVTVEDLIKPYFRRSERQLTRDGMCVPPCAGAGFFFGLVFIAMAGLASVLGGMLQVKPSVPSLMTVCEGNAVFAPVCVLCPQGGLSGLISGVIAALCVSLGEVFSPSPLEMTRPLPLSTAGCNFSTTPELNWTTAAPHPMVVGWLSPSYLYYNIIGVVTALTVGTIVSLLTGEHKRPSLLSGGTSDDLVFYFRRPEADGGAGADLSEGGFYFVPCLWVSHEDLKRRRRNIPEQQRLQLPLRADAPRGVRGQRNQL